jgi:hypothetical protein
LVSHDSRHRDGQRNPRQTSSARFVEAFTVQIGFVLQKMYFMRVQPPDGFRFLSFFLVRCRSSSRVNRG